MINKKAAYNLTFQIKRIGYIIVSELKVRTNPINIFEKQALPK